MSDELKPCPFCGKTSSAGMTDEKICPIMTSHDWVYCQKERCAAWVSEYIEQIPGDERYFGREARTIKYPARCALIKKVGRCWIEQNYVGYEEGE